MEKPSGPPSQEGVLAALHGLPGPVAGQSTLRQDTGGCVNARALMDTLLL